MSLLDLQQWHFFFCLRFDRCGFFFLWGQKLERSWSCLGKKEVFLFSAGLKRLHKVAVPDERSNYSSLNDLTERRTDISSSSSSFSSSSSSLLFLFLLLPPPFSSSFLSLLLLLLPPSLPIFLCVSSQKSVWPPAFADDIAMLSLLHATTLGFFFLAMSFSLAASSLTQNCPSSLGKTRVVVGERRSEEKKHVTFFFFFAVAWEEGSRSFIYVFMLFRAEIFRPCTVLRVHTYIFVSYSCARLIENLSYSF